MLANFKTKYKVECKIGEGSFSEVLKCLDKETGNAVAAKQLKKQFKSTNHALDIPELVALKKISSHPNILDLYESHFDKDTCKVTLIFELMDMSLYDLMKDRKRPIPESRSQNYLYQIIKGVYHLHFHGVFHRDIKPENILIKGEKLKISDLGSIKGFYSAHPYTEYISTRWYRSPECLLTRGFYGPKMDIWAVGCVFFELLTLRPLFPGTNELDQINKINSVLGSPSSKILYKFKKHSCRNMEVEFPFKKGSGLDTLLPMISQSGRDIIKQMIVYDPDARINIRRLLDHKYFTQMSIEESPLCEKSSIFRSSVSVPSVFLRSSSKPSLLQNYLSLTQRKRSKIKVPAAAVLTKKSTLVALTRSNIEQNNPSALSVMYKNNNKLDLIDSKRQSTDPSGKVSGYSLKHNSLDASRESFPAFKRQHRVNHMGGLKGTKLQKLQQKAALDCLSNSNCNLLHSNESSVGKIPKNTRTNLKLVDPSHVSVTKKNNTTSIIDLGQMFKTAFVRNQENNKNRFYF